ncbi:AMP-binding protein [Deferribacterales bacterium Es71-Z0220]|uniref:AMP-binding protein n=1 Tax=Deferrivibrio essentukiensis TaxID=2880922 RepID=UPI001F60B802|nr:AMP-binding protein [Deferrivibrio essentukiensis]MCB4204297.1 AMP-binding protein [Deferrivibrio essentukiensis]
MFTIIEKTIGDYLKEIVEKFPKNDAVVYPFRNIRLNYKEFDALTDKLAKGLLASGLKKGDHVAIWAHNIPEWIYLLFATAKIGVVTVTVNTLYKAHELKYLLNQSDSKALFMVKGLKSDYVETIYEILPELKNANDTKINNESLPLLEKIYFIGENTPNGMIDFNTLYDMAEKISDAELEQVKKSLDRHDVINMQYTSGTTGFPKGVMLSHFNVLNNAYAIALGMNFTDKDRLCIPVPFFHCFGLVLSILVCLSTGATMVPVESFNPVDVLKTVEAEKCTALHGVPTMFISELNLLDKEKYDTSSLRTGIMAGSLCPVEVMKAVMTKMNMGEITIVYGLTEASPGLTMTKIDDPVEKRVETVGKEMPGAEIKIVNPETEKECPANVQGELWARGYNIMRGYYKMEEATKHAFSNDGWLRTGDLAVKTEDGYYKITGRIKDMIIRGGENIYPKEIEEFYYTHPKIQDIQVAGVADKKYGEEVMAFVIVKEGETLTEDELRSYAKGKIADFKIPRYFAFVTEYPMTASGKIQKYKLTELGNKLLQEAVAN